MSDAIQSVQHFIDAATRERGNLDVLEAGCGSASYLVFGPKARIVGIDISQQQLDRNASLDEMILGDIQEHEFAPSSFDVIVCWDVLEHLAEPKAALVRFAAALRDDGIVILKLPNVLSFKGLLTKYLPYSAHVFLYRYVSGNPNAGSGDVGPFATPMRFSISADGIRKFAAENGLSEVYFATWDAASDEFWWRRYPWTLHVYVVLRAAAGFLSFGRLGESDFVIVLRKGAVR